MSTQPSPHGAVFRRILGQPENAASQFRAVLPPGLVARLDLAQLTRISENFVDPDLRWRHTDLLFTAPLDGTDAFIRPAIPDWPATCNPGSTTSVPSLSPQLGSRTLLPC